MDVRNYKKWFQSQQQQQQQYFDQNDFSPMNCYPPSYPEMNCYPPSPFRHQQNSQNHFHQHQQQHRSMMNAALNNPFSSMSMPPSNGMNFGNQFNMGAFHQQQQFQRNFQPPPPNCFNHPPPMSFPTMPSFEIPPLMAPKSSPRSFETSSDGSGKDETPREIFFKTLSSSLKDANKLYSGKQTTWKNPFLYKTHICENYCSRSFCRFGVNCWYAHGAHELRCIPESEELPDPEFITQYLSFLGLPKPALDQIIQHAYYVTNVLTSTDSQWFSLSKKSSEIPSFDSTRSTSQCNSPVKDTYQFINNEKDFPLLSETFLPKPSRPIKTPEQRKRDKFYSSYLSNGGWTEIASALNGVVDNGFQSSNDKSSPFGKSYHLFGNSFNPHKHW